MNELGALVLAHIPALVMMIVGYVLLIVEMYIPGFGVAGISGAILMIGGIALMEPTPLQALILALISVLLLGIGFSIAMHSFSKGRLSRSKLVLNAQVENPHAAEGEALILTHRQAMNLFFGPWSPERLRLPAFAAGWFPLSLFVPEVDND